jgi:hypothetical protein
VLAVYSDLNLKLISPPGNRLLRHLITHRSAHLIDQPSSTLTRLQEDEKGKKFHLISIKRRSEILVVFVFHGERAAQKASFNSRRGK